MGGTIATHLANEYPKLIEFLFVDRSFGTLEVMANSLIFGNKNNCLLKTFLFGGWPIRSDVNFYETKCFKIVTQDPWDEMIDMYSSLNTHVAKIACLENIGNKRHT